MAANRFLVEKSTKDEESKESPSKTKNFENKVSDAQEWYRYSSFEDPNETSKALFYNDESQVPYVNKVLKNLAHWNEEAIKPDDSTEEMEKKKFLCCFKKKKNKKTKKLGTLLGVYFPCIQNILGVILFIRMVWVVGVAGWLHAFIIVFICCCCTMTTAISMSAIATNGVVSSGGAYFMISRNLGPEFGGAVGILFYLGTTVASSMYIVGAVEILVQYMAPDLCFFGPVTDSANAYNSYRLYGTALLITMTTCVFIGVKFVSKLSPFALFCVLGSIFAIYVGIFVASPDKGPMVCFVGERLMASEKIQDANGTIECNKNPNGTIHRLFCKEPIHHHKGQEDFDYCTYLNKSKVGLKPGIPGLASGVFLRNTFDQYGNEGDRIGSEKVGDKSKGDIVHDITTSFIVMIGIFFPSVTGIMAGSNRSGDLADAQKSIPKGTIAAVATTSFIYLSNLLLFAATVEGQVLRDKFGESIGGGLVVAHLAWPNPWVIMIGSFFSTCGAGLQSLVGAPRLLQAIANDGIIPPLKFFGVTTRGEPVRALFLTALIAECGVLLANVDYIAPIITMFFLMCYCFTNLACAVQTLLKTPNWRPRFKFYHWALSLFGVLLCLGLMFVTSWYYALAAIGIAFFVYKYIEYKGAEIEWGDGLTGLSMSAARFALLRLEDNPVHVKNWRPQLLLLMKLDENTKFPIHPNLIDFASQLKAGNGLIMVTSVLPNKGEQSFEDVDAIKVGLQRLVKSTKAKGFVNVIVADDVGSCISYAIQDAGLGSLRHNTVLLAFPQNWKTDPKSFRIFFSALRMIDYKNLAVLVAKGIDDFPTQKSQAKEGTIDVWWIVHDGGLLMLLPFLLMKHKVWKACKMRIFTVAEMEDNSIKMKKDIEQFVYDLRMKAEVQVIEMKSTDISAYTYERTLMMEQRSVMWKEINSINPQKFVDNNRKFSVLPMLPEASMSEQQFTFTPLNNLRNQKPKTKNVRRMHSAVNINNLMKQKSLDAQLVFLNLPAVPKQDVAQVNYMEYVEVLTDGLKRVLMVKGSNKEVITIYA